MQGRGDSVLQTKDEDGVHTVQIAEEAEVLLQGEGNNLGSGVRHAHGKAAEPMQRMEGNESSMQGCMRFAG